MTSNLYENMLRRETSNLSLDSTTSSALQLSRMNSFIGGNNKRSAYNGPTEKEIEEMGRLQRQKQFQNILKLDKQFNPGNIDLINTLQDAEINDIFYFVDVFINKTMNHIQKNDDIIHVKMNNFKNTHTNPYLVNRAYRSSKNQQLQNQFSVDMESETKPTEFLFKIDSVNPVDFFRNGIRSGPIQIRSPNAESNSTPIIPNNSNNFLPRISTANTNSQSNKPNESSNSPTSSQLSFKIVQQNHYTTTPKDVPKYLIKLKYLLVVELNKKYFDIQKQPDKEHMYKIKLNKKPPKLSQNDYEQLTLDVKQSENDYSRKNSYSNLLKKNKTQSNITREPKPSVFVKQNRFLNTKALYDRLSKYFLYVLKTEWPFSEAELKQQQQIMLQAQQKQFEKPHHQYQFMQQQQAMPKSRIADENKKCYMKSNQLRASFKWKGNRLKDLDVKIYITIAIKHTNDELEKKTTDSVLDIVNKFIKTNGFFKTDIKELNQEGLFKLNEWLIKKLNFNIVNSYYLIPNYVHYWSLDVQLLKINLLKSLMWLNSLNPDSEGIDEVINALSNNTDSTGPATGNAFLNSSINMNTSMSTKQTSRFFNEVKYNFQVSINSSTNNSTFYLCKLLQIFMNMCFTWIDTPFVLNPNEPSPNKNNTSNNPPIPVCTSEDMYLDEDFIVDLIFLYIKNVKIDDSKKYLQTWENGNLFDVLWSCLLNFREIIHNCHAPDPLSIYYNVLPNTYLKYIGYFSLSMPLNSLESSSLNFNTYSDDKTSKKKQLESAIDNSLRIIMTNIVTEEIDIYSFSNFLVCKTPLQKANQAANNHIYDIENISDDDRKNKQHLKVNFNLPRPTSAQTTKGSDIVHNLDD